MEASRWSEALARLERHVARDDEQWVLRKARCLSELSRDVEALELLRDSVQRGVGTADLHLRLGLAIEQVCGPTRAIADMLAATCARGATARHHYFLGRTLERSGAHGQAAVAYKAYRRQRSAGGLPFLRELGGLLPIDRATVYGVLERPAYAYSVYRSALLASRLDVERCTVIELGVAGGRGLLQLEGHAGWVEEVTGVGIDVVGLDTGTGLPQLTDQFDMPHYFAEGDYPMDEDALRSRLTTAELIIGDARETLIRLLEGRGFAPVGALLFDMDTYSSTYPVLRASMAPEYDDAFLPRVACYFDDVVPKRPREFLKDYSVATGELRAIAEANADGSPCAVTPDLYFAVSPLREAWHSGAYLMHRFSHVSYGKNLGVSNPTGRSLEPET